MQIHEITKLSKKRTDEGLLDSFKAEVGLDPSKPDSRTFMQKLKGEIPRATDKNTPEYQAYQAKLDAQTQRLEKSFSDKGYKVGQAAIDATDPLKQAIAQVQSSPETQQQIQGLTKQFDVEFQPGMPDPGTRFIATTKNGGVYYKDDKGKWTEKETKDTVVKPESIAMLNQIVDSGGAKQIPAETIEPAVPVKGSRTGEKQVSESLLVEARKTLEQQNFENFIARYIKGQNSKKQNVTFADVLKNPTVRKQLTDIFKKMVVAIKSEGKAVNIPLVKKLFRQYVTIALAGKEIARPGNTDNFDDEEEQQSTTQVATGNPLADKLSQEISPEGLYMLEKDPEKGLQALKDIITVKKRGR